MSCPHAEIRFCPLFAAAHDGRLVQHGCVDDLEKPCRVKRGESYAALLGAVLAADPVMVAQVKWREEAELARAQRARNLRLNGIQ